jgi:hypothetical protein
MHRPSTRNDARAHYFLQQAESYDDIFKLNSPKHCDNPDTCLLETKAPQIQSIAKLRDGQSTKMSTTSPITTKKSTKLMVRRARL